MSEASRDAPASHRGGRGRGRSVALATLALGLCVGFVWLGNWQLRRLHWKLGLIHDVATRVHAPPVDAPGPGEWRAAASGRLDYLHVRLRGHFLGGPPTLVHGTSEFGYGYWVMAPLRTDRGFIVMINRGYVPAELPGTPAFGPATSPSGAVTLTGLLRPDEPGGGLLRRNRPAAGQWYSRDVTAMAASRGLGANAVAPYFVDADADTAAGRWPAAGLTPIRFPNHHLGYAITWYLMALGAMAAAVLLLWPGLAARGLLRG